MSDAKRDKRRTALLEWAAAAAADGHDVPTADELTAAAANPELVGAASGGPMLAWRATLEFILHQVKFGLDPFAVVQNLPAELTTPADVPASPRDVPAQAADARGGRAPATGFDAGTVDTPDAVSALMAWRSRKVAAGVDAAGAIKDATLRTLVERRFLQPEQIRKQLPGADLRLAGEVAQVLSDFFPQTTPSTADGGRDSAESERTPTTTAATSDSRTSIPVTPVAAEENAPPSVDTGLSLTHDDFCEFEYGESPGEPGAVTIVRGPDGNRLSWAPYAGSAGQTVIYRVVAADDGFPYKPEAGELLVATTELDCADPGSPTSAVRTYQVWCHVGSDELAARRNQPVLWAQGELVSPVENLDLTEDEGRVIAQWSVFPGTRSVRVYRVPLSRGTRGITDPRHEILADEPNLTGFVDTEVVRGETYLYRVRAEVSVGSTVRLADAVQREIQVSAVLEPVVDLTVSMSTGRVGEFDLRWSTPSTGRVAIYRSKVAPSADLAGSEMLVDALAPQGLDDRSLLRHPIVAGEAGSSRMMRVPWPSGWDRTYFTPVTTFGNKARVGVVEVHTRPLAAVTDARIIERFTAQIVSFGWPPAAASVLAWVAHPSLSAAEATTGRRPDEEIHLRHHRRDGGFTFRQVLPADCVVHLVPVAYSGGEQIRGEHVALPYPGLLRARYALVPVTDGSGERSVSVEILSEVDMDMPPPFVLVHNAERLPLGPHDGRPVPLTAPHAQQPSWQMAVDRLIKGQSQTGWRARLPDDSGFVRLFAYAPAGESGSDGLEPTGRQVALADPPLGTLRLGPVIGSAS